MLEALVVIEVVGLEVVDLLGEEVVEVVCSGGPEQGLFRSHCWVGGMVLDLVFRLEARVLVPLTLDLVVKRMRMRKKRRKKKMRKKMTRKRKNTRGER